MVAQITKTIPSLMRHQRWSEVNPEVIVEYSGDGTGKGKEHEPYWVISIDTPEYGYYIKFLEITKGYIRLNLGQLEALIQTIPTKYS